MENEIFLEFMKQQAEYFREKHGDCKDMTMSEIAEDSLEFRRRWSHLHDVPPNGMDDK